MEETFEKNYNELFDKIYRYVCCRIPNKEEAEDIVSETFFEAWKSLKKYDPRKGSLKAWLNGIAKNRIIKYWQKRLPTQEYFEEIINSAEDIKSKIDLEKTLSKLPPDHVSILTLRYIDELTYEEIARSLGKSETAVRKWFSRFHKTAKNNLTNYYND